MLSGIIKRAKTHKLVQYQVSADILTGKTKIECLQIDQEGEVSDSDVHAPGLTECTTQRVRNMLCSNLLKVALDSFPI
jgi:hypothetical protein